MSSEAQQGEGACAIEGWAIERCDIAGGGMWEGGVQG
eukprot:CAMPEP_0174703674 /NCGR_PEP_ID=MMETSP1094-20130205/7539_1 /TAXON_ID=156173 /ORGANISM="Chrysochromulina brevifilum, Strain UTEX LB 985" /LENGTH=36 /DNA_ID= /DNA_START= /DNA_END= /DNA_ORIENTATION=